MLRFTRHAVAALIILCLHEEVRAAYDVETVPSRASGIELVVVEADGCIYCELFRRDVLPLYKASDRAKRVPMRFADLNEVESGALAVNQPIDVVPTVLVLRERQEIGRVAGYLGPQSFFHAIGRMLSGLE